VGRYNNLFALKTHLYATLLPMTPWIKTRHLIHLYKRGYRFYRRFRYYDANHPFSIEMFDFLKSKHDWLTQFMAGRYQPEAMIGYNKRGPIEPIWRIKDRLLQRLLYDIITYHYQGML